MNFAAGNKCIFRNAEGVFILFPLNEKRPAQQCSRNCATDAAFRLLQQIAAFPAPPIAIPLAKLVATTRQAEFQLNPQPIFHLHQLSSYFAAQLDYQH